jgi:hypothetical protein
MSTYHGVSPQISSGKDGVNDDSNVLRDGTIRLLDDRIVYFQIWSESELVFLTCFFSKQELEQRSLESLIAYLAEQGFKGVTGYQKPRLNTVIDENGLDCWSVTFLIDDGEDE